MNRSIYRVVLITSWFIISGAVSGQDSPSIGIRAGVGTDINLGLAYGVGVNYLIDLQQNSLELGVVFYGGSFEESTDEGIHTYDETTDVIVFGAEANYLFGYSPGESGIFFLAGTGLAYINAEWEEKSDTDESLGTPLPGGGSMQSAEGSTGGWLFNLGVGGSFKGGLDIRAEIPMVVTFDAPGGSSSVIPLFTITLGYRF
jgi:hypothetical protein